MNVKAVAKPILLAALYNAAKTQGFGVLHYTPEPMTVDEAVQVILGRGKNLYFDYLDGRVMKVDLAPDHLDLRLYDRDNGPGAGERAITAALSQI